MADAAPVKEKKTRKAAGPRMPRKLFAVLGINEAGLPVVLKASYNAALLIPAFQANAGNATFAEISPEK